MRRIFSCPWAQTFFGQTQKYRRILFEEIFTLCYNGQGGFTHSEVYQMPTYLRKFYLRQLQQIKKAEKEKIEKAKHKSSHYSIPPAFRKSLNKNKK
jgi:hypothetical protein